MEFNIETEQDLRRLIGQYESIRLDFKASELLAQPKDRIIKQLSEDVSAFANTEGGVVVIGIRESKSGTKSVAAEIDGGVDPTQVVPEWLEQIITSNISPPIPGLTVSPIPLSGSKSGRVAYVVSVPKGSTAYQARHSLLYYGRTEFSATPLHENVIRLLMMRGRIAHGVIELSQVSCLTADDEHAKRRAQLNEERQAGLLIRSEKRKRLEAARREADEFSLSLAIRNDGPVTIRDCLLSISISGGVEAKLSNAPEKEQPWLVRFSDDAKIVMKGKTIGGLSSEEKRLIGTKLFPEQSVPFPGAQLTVCIPVGQAVPDCRLDWRLYLDDAPANVGSINLKPEFARLAPATSS